MHRRRDVLHLLRADVGELHRQLVGDLLVHRARNADAADLGEAFEARGDVDAIAEQSPSRSTTSPMVMPMRKLICRLGG